MKVTSREGNSVELTPSEFVDKLFAYVDSRIQNWAELLNERLRTLIDEKCLAQEELIEVRFEEITESLSDFLDEELAIVQLEN